MAAPEYEIIDSPIVVFDMLFWVRMQSIDTKKNPLDMIPVLVAYMPRRTTLTLEQIEQLEPDDFWEVGHRIIQWVATKALLLKWNQEMDKMDQSPSTTNF